ncbi:MULTISPECIES: DUF2934 domain-containing protein [unclassified Sinorhizobium]|uniref:DUF2934 domain-containing protein n=1 Tax=unclassified Sinorhizobium TaxID=2613772 RepID=UPI00352402D7
MKDERTEWIRMRAYALWEAAGRPDGCDQQHWFEASVERELMERTRASLDGSEVLLRFPGRQRSAPVGTVYGSRRKIA